MPNSARDIVRSVLPRNMADEIWSAGYDKALPVSFNRFELSAALPAVFYMFRFGTRRGSGQFHDVFVPEGGTRRERRRKATVERVAKRLASRPDVHGFDGAVEKAVLGDLLLCFALENATHELGRDRQIQRVAPAHYMACWVDLPESVTALRFVPEMIVAMLANQQGTNVTPTSDGDRTWFPVARGFERNELLRPFLRGVTHVGVLDNRASDRFDETDESVGLDQLLMIRLAQQLRAAPDRPRGKATASISNQRPIAEKAAEQFSEDIRRFVRAYADRAPRYAFIDMLESCMTIGMTTVLTSVVEILFAWYATGTIVQKDGQQPADIFVDCSNGVDTRLRDLAEQSLDDLMRRVDRMPVVLMVLRLLDYEARDNKNVKGNIPTRPYATAWLDLLGDLLHGRHSDSGFIHRTMENQGDRLAAEVESEYPEAAAALRRKKSEPNPVRRMAAGLTPLLGSNHRSNLMGMVDSTLQVGRLNGLAHKRFTTRGADAGRRRRDVRSLVLSNHALDYLVHLQLLRSGNGGRLRQRPLSLTDFLDRIRKRYGFHVDAAPDGMTVSNELLQANRGVLERRLRDLGLLTGVNDAEAMKRLRPRFELEGP